MSDASYRFGTWRLWTPGGPAAWPLTPLEIDRDGIKWEETSTTKSGLFGRKSERVVTRRTLSLADVRNATCGWNGSGSDIYNLWFKTSQGEDVAFSLTAPGISRDQLREAVAVLQAHGISVEDRHDLL